MINQNDNDERLIKILKTNKPVVPAAPSHELSFLMKKIEDQESYPKWFTLKQYGNVLAACIVIAVSIFIVRFGARNIITQQETVSLVDYAYESIAESVAEDDDIFNSEYFDEI